MPHISSGIILDGKRILLIKRSKDKRFHPGYWAGPAGRSEEGETPAETVIREVKEEVGLDFKPKAVLMEQVGNGKAIYRFLGEWSGEVVPEPREVDDWAWFSYEKAKGVKMSENFRQVLERLRKEGLL